MSLARCRVRTVLAGRMVTLALAIAGSASAEDWVSTLGPGAAFQSAPTPDGGFIVVTGVGAPTAPWGGEDGLLVKLTSMGAVEWAVAVGGPLREYFYGAAVLPDGYIVAGAAGQQFEMAHLIAMAFDLSGNIRWQRDYGAVSWFDPHAIQPSSDGAFFVPLVTFGPSSPGLNYTVLKLAPDGSVIGHQAIDPLVVPTRVAYRPERERPRSPRIAWADLLKRVFVRDVLVCPRCNGRMSIIATVTDPSAVRAILECLGLAARPPPLSPAQEREQGEFEFGG